MNKQGYESFDKVLAKGLRGLSAQAFEAAMSGGQALVLDTRAPGAFKEGFIPGSLSIGLNGDFAPWVGALISDLNRPILFVADPGREEEVVTRLARVGYDNPIGYLLGGLQAWQEAGFPTDRIDTVSAAELQALLSGGVAVLDVRKASEHGSEHLRYAGTQNLPLDFLPQRLAELQPGRTYYLHCAGGYRSVIAASLLKAAGYAQVVDVAGGFKALKAAGLPVSDYVCPTTML
jgi:rhodanese-related sulfurtransferase